MKNKAIPIKEIKQPKFKIGDLVFCYEEFGRGHIRQGIIENAYISRGNKTWEYNVMFEYFKKHTECGRKESEIIKINNN